MIQTTYKKIPFDLELAKRITNKEVKGRSVTQGGLKARIIFFDMWCMNLNNYGQISNKKNTSLIMRKSRHSLV